MSDQWIQILAGACALLIAAAGWFYLFYSTAAQRLSGIEDQRSNVLRVRLRRIGGIAMIALACAFYVGCVALLRKNLSLFGGMMFGVLLLMAAILVLGLIDLRLTQRLRRRDK